METSEVKKVTETYSAIIGHLFDTIIIAPAEKKIVVPSRQNVKAVKCWKPLSATLKETKNTDKFEKLGLISFGGFECKVV